MCVTVEQPQFCGKQQYLSMPTFFVRVDVSHAAAKFGGSVVVAMRRIVGPIKLPQTQQHTIIRAPMDGGKNNHDFFHRRRGAIVAVILFIVGSGLVSTHHRLADLLVAVKDKDGGGSMQQLLEPATNNHEYNNLTWNPVNHTTNNKTATLCLVAKDPQRRYLDEWADYHILALGFTKLRLYDNTPEFALKDWAKETHKPYPVETIHYMPGVTHSWPNSSALSGGTAFQDVVYRDCIRSEVEKGTNWVAAFDLDEFMVLKKKKNNGTTNATTTNVLDFMDQYCPPHTSCGQVSLNWVNFGTCNRTKYVPVPVSRRNFCSEESARSPWVKAIVDPKAVKYDDPRLYWIHTFPLHNGRTWLDTTGRVIKARNKRWNMQKNPESPIDVAALYHFRGKSEEEWWYRNCVRADVNNHTMPCQDNKTKAYVPTGPIRHDDTVWQTLRLAIPSYRRFDHVTDLG